jgi:hypothetical protein
MIRGRLRQTSVLLGLIFVAVFATVAHIGAQTPGQPVSKLKAKCERYDPDKPVDAKDLTNSLPCEESFGQAEGSALDAEQRKFQKGFDFFSWLTFIALNAPNVDDADITAIGSTDPPTKWEQIENFRQLGKVMRPGSKPDWNDPEVPPACNAKHQPGMTVIYRIEEAYNQPFKSGPLVDQNGRYAYFDILMNKEMFDYIIGKDLFTQKGQAGKPDGFVIDFPVGKNTSGDKPGALGALMLKVSWKQLDPIKDQDLKGKIHAIKALIYSPPSEDGKRPAACSDPVDLGLIGFHAGHKTQNRRQWIWTTFEHVQNVPERVEVNAVLNDPAQKMKLPHDKYFFFDVAQPRLADNRTPPKPWNPDVQPFPDGFKSQITRVIPLTPDTKRMNEVFKARIKGTVWENYMLVSTQWPSNFSCSSTKQDDENKQPDMTCAPVPTYLANSTLETFSQGAVPLASSSCMSCHNNAASYQRTAAQSDFTFIIEKAPKGE